MKVKSESEVTQSCLTLCDMGFFRQEYWSGLPFPSPGDLPDPGVEPRSPTLQADALTSEPRINIAFIMLKYVPSVPAFWRVFIINGC